MQITESSVRMEGISFERTRVERGMRLREREPSPKLERLGVRIQSGVPEGFGKAAMERLQDELPSDRVSLADGQRLVRLIIEAMTGRTLELSTLTDGMSLSDSLPAPSSLEFSPVDVLEMPVLEEFRREIREEGASFLAEGVVQTADGREIRFSVNQMHQHQEITETATEIRLVDPLMVALDGPVDLTARKFSFDLDVDGYEEEISIPANGVGFLFLDKNGNGKLDDGSELFGPQSGDGFADLEAFDADGNGWIDTGDPVFAKLRIWHPEDGTDGAGVSASSAGLGAIGLMRVATDTDIGADRGGRLRTTGVVLTEDGNVGTVHHVDLRA